MAESSLGAVGTSSSVGRGLSGGNSEARTEFFGKVDCRQASRTDRGTTADTGVAGNLSVYDDKIVKWALALQRFVLTEVPKAPKATETIHDPYNTGGDGIFVYRVEGQLVSLRG
jgi:hypothetical protein